MCCVCVCILTFILINNHSSTISTFHFNWSLLVLMYVCVCSRMRFSVYLFWDNDTIYRLTWCLNLNATKGVICQRSFFSSFSHSIHLIIASALMMYDSRYSIGCLRVYVCVCALALCRLSYLFLSLAFARSLVRTVLSSLFRLVMSVVFF